MVFRGYDMRRNVRLHSRSCIYVAAVLLLLGVFAVTPRDLQAGAPQVQRLIFVSAGFNESNRFWIISRPQHLQFDPFLETLLDLDPKTGDYVPRLAETWESSPDKKEWTF